jgi:hypothetical protein
MKRDQLTSFLEGCSMDTSEMKWVIPHTARGEATSDDYSAFDHSVTEQ